jgi:RND family efflux transporter MFP subunit
MERTMYSELKSLLRMVGLGLVLSACRGGGAQEIPQEGPRQVRSAAVESAAVSPPIVAAGTMGPKEEVNLAFKVGGVIESVRVDAGQAVPAGATLATLDLREIDAAVTRAESAAEKAERDLARARRLYGDSVVTLVQLQDAETAARVARADLDAARFNRRHAVITAPAAGVILRRSAEPGETVAPGTPIVVLGSRARGVVMRMGLTDRDVLRVQRGDRATIRFDALPGRSFEGRVSEIAGSADAGTGTWAVEVSVAGVPEIAAGLVGQVQVQPAAGTRVSLIPIEALLEADGAAATVFVLSADGRRVQRRRITVAWLEDDRVIVAGGLEGVTSVVTDGAAWLNDGDIVQVVR